jgi:MoaA/NifB/PqqE/SkfB family radical SAM enzyme
MLKVITTVPSYYSFRLVGRPRKLPMNLTLSVSFNCNSRCKTCNIQHRNAEELSLAEWHKVLASLGKSPFWVTISGGEPFLRKDLSGLVSSVYDQCSPAVINIPTNGLLVNRITEAAKQIALHCKRTQIVINVSIDEIGEMHDFIRGVKGSYDKALETFHSLRGFSLPNLSVGIHTVISRFNVDRIPEIYQTLRCFNPDSYITEIAEEREELCTMNSDITPGYEAYSQAVDYLTRQLSKDHFGGIGKITRAIRAQYYKIVERILIEHRQVIPCHAGFASAQIAPGGDVWMCCVRAESVGNLRDVGYDFKRVWFSEKAYALRKRIKDGECHCPLANAGYTNILHSIRALSHVGWNLIRMN